MTRTILGIDPAFGQTGFAAFTLDADGRERCAGLQAIGGLAGSPERTFVERLWPAVQSAIPLSTTWRCQLFIERPPPAARHDVERASQADIGFCTGFMGGMVAGAWLARGLPLPHVVEVSDWRNTMVIEAGRMRLDLFGELAVKSAPRLASRVNHVKRASSGPGFVVEFGCGHEWIAKDFGALSAKPDICPTCVGGGTATRGEDARERWKRGACRFVAAKWPEPYKAVVDDARSRAKTIGAEDAKLVGVADACEAAVIAFHGVEMIRGGLCVTS